eukprot:6122292-Alexandrium_andersonii.AAC.1
MAASGRDEPQLGPVLQHAVPEDEAGQLLEQEHAGQHPLVAHPCPHELVPHHERLQVEAHTAKEARRATVDDAEERH